MEAIRWRVRGEKGLACKVSKDPEVSVGGNDSVKTFQMYQDYWEWEKPHLESLERPWSLCRREWHQIETSLAQSPVFTHSTSSPPWSSSSWSSASWPLTSWSLTSWLSSWLQREGKSPSQRGRGLSHCKLPGVDHSRIERVTPWSLSRLQWTMNNDHRQYCHWWWRWN